MRIGTCGSHFIGPHLRGPHQLIIGRQSCDAMLRTEGSQIRLDNLAELKQSIYAYETTCGEECTLEHYLAHVAMFTSADLDDPRDQVRLMTVHSAKGLEFPYVFVVGMEDGIFPGEMAKYNEEDMEEERRLCYVAITRAKKELYLSTSRTRMIFGQTRRNPPSTFLSEIDPDLLDESQSPELAGYGGGFGAGYGLSLIHI